MSLYERVKIYVAQATGLTLCAVALLLAKPSIVSLYETDRMLAVFAGLLVAWTGVSFFVYHLVVSRELDLVNSTFIMEQNGQVKLSVSEGTVYSTALLIGLSFALLVYLAIVNLLWYCAVTAAFQIIDHFGQETVNANVARAYRERRFHRSTQGSRRAEIVYQYYLENAVLLPDTFRAVAAGVAAVVFVLRRPEIAYVVLLISLPVAEVPYWIWRRRRDREWLDVRVKV